jgi:hypothetical protein
MVHRMLEGSWWPLCCCADDAGDAAGSQSAHWQMQQCALQHRATVYRVAAASLSQAVCLQAAVLAAAACAMPVKHNANVLWCNASQTQCNCVVLWLVERH